MIATYSTLKRTSLYAFYCAVLALVLASCNKHKRSDMANTIYKVNKNKAFNKVTPEGFDPVFKKVLAERKKRFNHPEVITAFYEQNGYDPVLVLDHMEGEDLKTLASYLNKSGEHGLDPKMFQAKQLNDLVNKFYSKDAIKTTDEAYQTMAELEASLANALINYTNALQYGVISPRKIYARYYTETKRPDSVSMKKVFGIADMKTFLDSIQPKDPQYIALQKALASNIQVQGQSAEETDRLLKVNLERLRWKNKPNADKYVIVNIPDYRLDVVQGGKSVMNMKVCVGEGRNVDKQADLTEYDESDKVDRPFSRETPQLNSMIYTAQVNPVWNIPKSIATKEIMVQAAQDPYYLSNHNMDAYKGGKMVEDPETIDWGSVNPDEYSFKQRPGDDNALGKIKFLFKNKSSVYLHDTPAKLAFDRPMRAVSHGCVRVERPLDLAQALYGDGSKFETIKKDMESGSSEPHNVDLSNKVPVYLTYVTCWVDSSGTLQFRKDVYGLDAVLLAHLNKYLTA
ncbi:L,D-transpeptidase family protein [Mucilaginibacter daejeonensis]|uniref:L,D-transpeptidase family protein n=1 Tax=Mucilaginibacter daejeonensis TaxID=398049 RepID=UPI001D17204A|nr:L,D-transpeptidase family protein [Mucilaginibacter daejeonensis]UEG55044.1 L,D-transpeptidase family protein [Mucilaginibacter daejeonensis]